ncbi:MAG: hypothetical protein KA169_21270, partial [Burkholderiaceae bacterium]|nr:hypothetical protein [Burkholderiaceae bacterium]
PYLIQQGFLQRTPRGRIATQAAYRHFGIVAARAGAEQELFDSPADAAPPPTSPVPPPGTGRR